MICIELFLHKSSTKSCSFWSNDIPNFGWTKETRNEFILLNIFTKKDSHEIKAIQMYFDPY